MKFVTVQQFEDYKIKRYYEICNCSAVKKLQVEIYSGLPAAMEY